jgi:hypothetical protein
MEFWWVGDLEGRRLRGLPLAWQPALGVLSDTFVHLSSIGGDTLRLILEVAGGIIGHAGFYQPSKRFVVSLSYLGSIFVWVDC